MEGREGGGRWQGRATTVSVYVSTQTSGRGGVRPSRRSGRVSSSPAAKVNRSFLSSLELPLFRSVTPVGFALRVSEGAGEVSQSRIPPSHPASWYSCHAAAAARCPLRDSLPARPPAY